MPARRIVLACALSGALIAPAAATALAATPKPTPAPAPAPAPAAAGTVPPGVTAGGIDLAGLTAPLAAAKLNGALGPHLARPVAFDVGGKVFRLTTTTAKFAFDADATAAAAVAASQNTAVPLVVTHATTPVRDFVTRVARASRREAQDATLKIGVQQIHVHRSRYGYRVDQAAAYRLINAALNDGAASRKLHVKLRKVRAKVNTNDLARQYATILTVDKSTRTLRLFKRFKVVKTYKVAIGQPAYPTPEGLFHIQNKQINPTWSVPNSPWAGELAGTTVQGGSAQNPLKARWMGVTDGVGFHGTGEDYSVGQAASHGCMRMHVADIIALYPRVPVGTPVLIAP
ncbi:L,D-transpeptidase/peptidoglycan binding protein [Paraconexibacter antarcticus]|uniref:L,D-transpeptidase/peptidoglycan binding protein n=1 Tax=Paraconexibacter antarcticus TaxID=2949664 RepID=A0ABY5DS97_9ACTN|nr:L,D-transpeptidase family protein [Paraconexibacter antarcticus]UTI64896.1 L,D-transpeptidase/peptidoglycan binding protein [Paraconexibacter antarcticus]